jgi:tetratricopeptide (TPR) repeat protein
MSNAELLYRAQKKALTSLRRGNFKRALDFAEQALVLIEGAGADASVTAFASANCREFLALILSKLGRHDEAVVSAEMARALYREAGNDREFIAQCDSMISHVLHRAGRSEEADNKLMQARALFLEVGEFKQAAMCLAVQDMWKHGVDTELKVEFVG